MSDKKPKLFGNALKKARRLAKAASLRDKNRDSINSDSSGLSAAVCNDDVPQGNVRVENVNTASNLSQERPLHGTAPSGFLSDGSPFFGFSPVAPLHSRQFFKSTPELSDDNKPFFGFSTQQEFTLKRRSANFDAHPIYSTDLPMTPILSKRQTLSVEDICTSAKTPDPDITPVESHDKPAVEPSVETTVEPPVQPSVKSTVEPTVEPIVEPTVEPTVEPPLPLPPVRPFYKIVLGNLCQFSPVFPDPHHQCAAMAAVALGYDTLKSVDDWHANDIDLILHTGQKYYNETMLNLELNNSSLHNGFLEAAELNETVTICSHDFKLQCDFVNSKGGPHYSADVLKKALFHFEMNDFAYGIITYRYYSYGLLRCHNAADNTYYYVFFDSHGRQNDGSKVVDREYMMGNAAILFFYNANDFIHFFLEQFPLREAASHHILLDNLILVPVGFLNDRPPIQQDYFTQYDQDDLSQEDELRFQVLYGRNCESDMLPLPHNHHSCCSTVLFSFVYSTLHSITTWDEEDFSAILDYGNIFHRKIYDQEITINMEYNATVPLLPHQFQGDVNLENKNMKLIVGESEFPAAFNKPNIRNAIAHFESFDNAFGLLQIKEFYYGIVVLLMGSNRRYALFDSHGRRSDGFGKGPHCVLLIFPDIENIVNFIYEHCFRGPTFTLYPVQIAPISDEPRNTESQYEPFIKLVADKYIESDITEPEQHTFCLALCIIALSYMYVHGIDSLPETSLSYIFESGISYFNMCNERANGTLTDISDYATEFGMEDVGFNMCLDGISATRYSRTFVQLTRNLAYFYESIIYDFAILKMGSHHYAISKCKESGKVVFYDVHGRTEVGVTGGNLSTAIYFESLDSFINFIKEENHNWCSSTVHYIRFVRSEEANCSNLYSRYVSGAFAQDDARFDSKSRDTQCTANSVVFLAFAFIIENDWMSCDVDSILELGDHIYTASFEDALAKGPRNNTFLAAHEIRPNIFVNASRLNRGVIKIKCVPVPHTDFYGNGQFARDGQQRIDLFFRHYKYGVFICCARSVGLYKFEDQFVLFEPHPRSVDGKLEPKGTAKIFYFANIPSLFQFISRFGYGQTREFSLTPFVVTQLDENLRDRRKNVPLPSHRPAHENEFNEEDSFDDIPMRGSDDWSPLDNIPLIQLNDSSDDNVPLIGLRKKRKRPIQPVVPSPTVIRSLPLFKTQAEKDRDKKREKVKYQRRQKTEKLLPLEEQHLRQRWKVYMEKIRRTHTPNIYGNYDEYVQWFYTHKEDGSDDEIVEAAINAQNEYERVEQTRLLRLQNNAAIPTHFHAFGNHEEINDTEPMYAFYELSPMNLTCPYCGALYFKEECNARNVFTLCCNSGQIHSELPQKQARNYPHILRDLLLNQSPLSRHFLDNIMLFNNVLSFASLGTTTLHHMQARGSLGPVIAMEGMIYHIAEHFHTNSTGEDMPTAQLYYIDSSVAVAERQARAGVTLNASLLKSLENFMRANNPLARAYRMLKDVLDEVKRRPNAANTNVHLQIVRNRDQIRIRQNHGGDFAVPTSNEVAVVYTDLPSAASKNIIVFPVDQTPEQGIPLASHDPNRDAMMYPILFPFSEQTWSYTLRRRTKEEVAAMNAPPEEAQESEVETTESEPENEPQSEPEDDGRESRRPKKRVRITVREFFTFLLMIRVAFTPLLNAGKLTQQFIIDAYSRAQDNTFEYLMTDRGQAQIRAETYGALKDYIDRKKIFQPDLPGKLIVMPNDIVGSRQYMKRRYADALSMVARYGKPTFFITMTCNPMWKEITSRIPRGANPVDRPDVVARVFKAKVKELIHDISKKHVLGRCVAYLAVIEWQKRSLPHCHLLSFNAPEDKPATNVDIDNFVSAEIPSPNGNTARLYDYVTTYMYHHRCDDTTRRESCRIPRKGIFSCPRHPKPGEQADTTKDCICYVCSKRFPRDFASKSQLIEGSYPIYRRRMNGRKFTSSRNQEIDNRWIVPYNPYLLLKYNCHMNVEITSSLKSIKYLFKYLHKGLDMARLNISVIDNVQVYNEFEHFLDCRYLSAGESIWKLFAYDMFYQSHSVYSLPVHLENYQNVTFHAENPAAALEHTGSHLTAYFELNRVDERARQFFYADIPLHYVYNTKTKTWTPRKRRHEKTLSRMYTVNYNNVELYALRLLLLTVKGALSYEHLRNVDGIQYDTFRDAASALGLLEGDELIIQTFEEIMDVELPYRIRCLFVNMLIFNTPSDPLAIWEQFKSRMCEDYVRKGCSDEMAENLALRHISHMLNASDKTNTDFYLPESTFAQRENAAEINLFADDMLINLADEAVAGQRYVDQLQGEQRVIFDEIMDSVRNPNDPQKNRLFFVDGPGGSGKTFLFSTLISVLNGMGKTVLPIAWTGIAASLLKGGRTAHSAFKLPFEISSPIACNLSTTSDLADEFRKATVIVWDEISMTISYALDAVDTFFRDLMGNNLPFGGKVFIATGDFRQILPVVKGGSKIELLRVIAKRATVWPSLQKRSLRTNLRLTDSNDIEFAQLLLNIGEDNVSDLPANEYFGRYVKIPDECIEENSLLDRIYGTSFPSSSVDHFSKIGIMTTLNEDVNMLNNEIYKRMTEDVPTERSYLSTDSVIDLDPNDDDAYDVSMLNAMEPPNLPPHILTLKENCIIMLLCNINPSLGLCNGTRLVVTKLYRTCIRAKILTGNFKDEEVLLSRCRMKTESLDVSCKVQRIQIPVKLGFATTLNKAQGQSFDIAGIYFRKAPFSHGHLYVAMSRARSKDKLIVQVLPDTFMGKLKPDCDDVFVPNIVYKEALC